MKTNGYIKLDDEIAELLNEGAAEYQAPFQRIQVRLSELPLSVPSGSLAKAHLCEGSLRFGTLVFKQEKDGHLRPRRFLRLRGEGALLCGDSPEEMPIEFFSGPLYEVDELTLSGMKLKLRVPDGWELRKLWFRTFFSSSIESL